MHFYRLLIYFKINLFEKFYQEYHLSVQSVSKGYQQTTLVGNELKDVCDFFLHFRQVLPAWKFSKICWTKIQILFTQQGLRNLCIVIGFL